LAGKRLTNLKHRKKQTDRKTNIETSRVQARLIHTDEVKLCTHASS
jgi:hypothetical protein